MKGLDEGRLFIAIVLAGFLIGFFYYVSITYVCYACPCAYESPDITGHFSETATAGEYRIVTRVIDGDTVVVSGGDHVRLLGIDTDERGDPCYKTAKERLEELVFNKEVYLEPDMDDKDQYGRLLRHIILDGKNINLKMVEEGLAIARFYPENVKYKEDIASAEKTAMDNKIGCKWSSN